MRNFLLLILAILFSYSTKGQNFIDMLGKDEKAIREFSSQDNLKFVEQEIDDQLKTIKFSHKSLPVMYDFYINKKSGTCSTVSFMSTDSKIIDKLFTMIKENYKQVKDKEYTFAGLRYVIIPPFGFFVEKEQGIQEEKAENNKLIQNFEGGEAYEVILLSNKVNTKKPIGVSSKVVYNNFFKTYTVTWVQEDNTIANMKFEYYREVNSGEIYKEKSGNLYVIDKEKLLADGTLIFMQMDINNPNVIEKGLLLIKLRRK